MRRVSIKIFAAGVLLALALAGCVVTPVGGEVMVYQPPPPPRYEVIGVAPTPGYFWIGGAWFWERGGYSWHPGHWEAGRPGYRWVGPAWGRYGNGWRMRQGRWVRR